jgi:hypothetical protein
MLAHDGWLHVGGRRTLPDGTFTSGVGRWDGDGWAYVGDGFDGPVLAVESYEGEMVVGGLFFIAPGDVIVNGLAARGPDGAWHTLGAGGVAGNQAILGDFIVYNGDLLASGDFTSIGGVPVNGLGRWDGEAWNPFGPQPVGGFIIDEGELYGIGGFGSTSVARWNPALEAWEPLGTLPPNSPKVSLTFYNGELIAGGLAGIGSNAQVHRWDGTTWHAMGGLLGNFGQGLVRELVVYNGELIAGGDDGSSGFVQRWTGTTWAPLPGGDFTYVDQALVLSLCEYHGNLVVGGRFTGLSGPNDPENLQMWNGSSWQKLGEGTNGVVEALEVHNGELIVGGWFDIVNEGPGGSIGRWGPVGCAPGDANCNGLVDLDDVPTFVAGLLDSGNVNGCAAGAIDVNDDGLLNGGDVSPFVDCVLVGGCP